RFRQPDVAPAWQPLFHNCLATCLQYSGQVAGNQGAYVEVDTTSVRNGGRWCSEMRLAAPEMPTRMLLSITTTHKPATDLGYLLHKNPARSQQLELAFGRAHMFYSEVTDERCTFALVLDIDPIGLVRGGNGKDRGLLDQYVNDRPYAASSYLSV